MTTPTQPLRNEHAHLLPHIERIGAVERNILRLALYELEEGEAAPAVIINEAVRLAHWFAGAKAPAFVNGVLDALARRLGRL